MRTAQVSRNTQETKISVSLNLDGTGQSTLATGIGFFDHMLDQIARHGLIDLTVKAKGDLHIDFHHTTEDSGIALGQAVAQALGDRRGIRRWGDALVPMDETLTRVALDASNRPYLIWKVEISRPKLGEMDTELFKEWFQAFAQNAGVFRRSMWPSSVIPSGSAPVPTLLASAGNKCHLCRASRVACVRIGWRHGYFCPGIA